MADAGLGYDRTANDAAHDSSDLAVVLDSGPLSAPAGGYSIDVAPHS